METLKELRAKYKQLKKESKDIYNQIIQELNELILSIKGNLGR